MTDFERAKDRVRRQMHAERRRAVSSKAQQKPKRKEATHSLISRGWVKLVAATAALGVLQAVFNPLAGVFDFLGTLKPAFSMPTSEGEELPPFIITNTNNWFDLKNVRLGCHVFGVESLLPGTNLSVAAGGIGPQNPFETWSTPHGTINAGTKLNYSCNISNQFRGLEVNGNSTEYRRAKLQIEMSYTISVLGIPVPRHVKSPEYRGARLADRFHWIEGPLAQP